MQVSDTLIKVIADDAGVKPRDVRAQLGKNTIGRRTKQRQAVLAAAARAGLEVPEVPYVRAPRKAKVGIE
jgi:hypothetical protein